MTMRMKCLFVLMVEWFASTCAGSMGVSSELFEDVSVQTSVRVCAGEGEESAEGNFFLVRSMLCRQLFSAALTNLSARTGRAVEDIRGATICGIDESFDNGIQSMRLKVAWSLERESAVEKFLEDSSVEKVRESKISEGNLQGLLLWIGPKQIVEPDGTTHFIGVSAVAGDQNDVFAELNVRRAELDSKWFAVRPFLEKNGKLENAQVEFRPVMRSWGRHPSFPDCQMFACGYEVVSLKKDGVK